MRRWNGLLTAAVKRKDLAIVKMLLEASADVNYKPGVLRYHSAIAMAHLEGNREMVELLEKHGAEIPSDSETCTSGEDDESDSAASEDGPTWQF